MRRHVYLTLLVLSAASLAACGKGGYTVAREPATSARTRTVAPGGTATTVPTSPSTPPPAGGAPSHARALAFAHAVNLTPEDVPGFTPTDKHEGDTARSKRLEHEALRCISATGAGAAGPGITGGGGVAEQSSKDFRLQHGIIDFSVSSEVTVLSSPATAQRNLHAIRNPKVRGCFSHYLQQLFAGERFKGATPGQVSIQGAVPPAPGSSGGFAWRVTANFLVRGVKIPIYLDFLGFVEGPAQVTLLSSGLIRPFPAEVQQKLFSLLLTRAKAHAL
ncbi:MAG TPA: hypothetical protein VL988_01680 [Solirubrobacteraceae bacterium]|nr:hypothetical protein [Solirubrobacteraceae bacterium]